MPRQVVVVGGGAAGMFAAIGAAEGDRDLSVTVLEKGPDLLQKVGISGGGRCNVTHDCRDPRALVRHYPRGERELRGMFARFAAQDTIDWFAGRGVRLKTEADGRMFPVTDRSETVIGTLIDAARTAGVSMLTRRTVRGAERVGDGFRVHLDDGGTLDADRLLITTGGMRGAGARRLAESFGHTVADPVPSLFTFHIDDPRIAGLQGLSVADAELRIVGERCLRNRGPVLITHAGVSGPGVLKLSALGARELAARDYRFEVDVAWLVDLTAEQAEARLLEDRDRHPRRRVVSTVPEGLPRRLWERLVAAAGLPDGRVWAEIRRDERRRLAAQLTASRFRVAGKSLNKDEFVTCGGVVLK
ncbi:aminoacetone oxidase family FAD-binding enzyme, partial [bacterium]|nr:aminoacetone oxidase family FAD-binding enzyme [bacterium]